MIARPPGPQFVVVGCLPSHGGSAASPGSYLLHERGGRMRFHRPQFRLVTAAIAASLCAAAFADERTAAF